MISGEHDFNYKHIDLNLHVKSLTKRVNIALYISLDFLFEKYILMLNHVFDFKNIIQDR
jgi:hypothetical protein